MFNNETSEKMAFNVTQHKGVRIRFKNGYSVSIQWGPGNYCKLPDNVDRYDFYAPKNTDHWRADTAEIAIFDPNDKWATRYFFPDHCDDVIGHLTAEEVANILYRVSLTEQQAPL